MRTAFAQIRKIRALSAADCKPVPGALLAVVAARARLLLVPITRVRDWAAAPALRAARVGRALAAASVRVPGGRNGVLRAIECCRTHAEIFPETLRHLLLDAVIPGVLDLIGIESMHATAVLTDYGACAFIGPTGTGKSTLAASFALAGFPLLGDDCVVLSLSGSGRILLTPGYPGTRLRNDSLEALRIDSVRSHASAGYSSKRRALDLHSSFTSEPQPLRRIFRLSRCDAGDSGTASPRIEPLSPVEVFMELASASCRFNPTNSAANLRQFHFLEQVGAKVPVKKLVVPTDFAALPAVREMMLADMSGRDGDTFRFSEVC